MGEAERELIALLFFCAHHYSRQLIYRDIDTDIQFSFSNEETEA